MVSTTEEKTKGELWANGKGERCSGKTFSGRLYSSRNLKAMTEQVTWGPAQNYSPLLHGLLIGLCPTSLMKCPKLSLGLKQTQCCALIFLFYVLPNCPLFSRISFSLSSRPSSTVAKLAPFLVAELTTSWNALLVFLVPLNQSHFSFSQPLLPTSHTLCGLKRSCAFNKAKPTSSVTLLVCVLGHFTSLIRFPQNFHVKFKSRSPSPP